LKKNNFARNFCIGLVDGITIPLAVAAGLSTLVINSTAIVIACGAVSFAGAMTMSVGGFFESRKYNAAENPVRAATIIGFGYLTGGVATVVPYIINHTPLEALRNAVIISMCILFVAGYWESRLNGSGGWVNAIRVCITAAIAATAAYFVAKLFR
jgi:VIT1/CCC1 family predicted Fe2+/Mn2+ transporter